jgi:hypothetical protein
VFVDPVFVCPVFTAPVFGSAGRSDVICGLALSGDGELAVVFAPVTDAPDVEPADRLDPAPTAEMGTPRDAGPAPAEPVAAAPVGNGALARRPSTVLGAWPLKRLGPPYWKPSALVVADCGVSVPAMFPGPGCPPYSVNDPTPGPKADLMLFSAVVTWSPVAPP